MHLSKFPWFDIRENVPIPGAKVWYYSRGIGSHEGEYIGLCEDVEFPGEEYHVFEHKKFKNQWICDTPTYWTYWSKEKLIFFTEYISDLKEDYNRIREDVVKDALSAQLSMCLSEIDAENSFKIKEISGDIATIDFKFDVFYDDFDGEYEEIRFRNQIQPELPSDPGIIMGTIQSEL